MCRVLNSICLLEKLFDVTIRSSINNVLLKLFNSVSGTIFNYKIKYIKYVSAVQV